MEQQHNLKVVLINEYTVPRPYTDRTYQITEGIYIAPTLGELQAELQRAHNPYGLQVVDIKPLEFTLREYHDNTGSNQSGKEVPERSDSGQPADE